MVFKMDINMKEYAKIRALLKNVYVSGLSDDVISSGFILAFYISGNILTVTINPEVLFEKTLTVRITTEITEKLSEVAMTVGLKGIAIKDNKGRFIVRKTW